MKKNSRIACLILITALLYSCESKTTLPEEKSMTWIVQGKNKNHFILGTIHAAADPKKDSPVHLSLLLDKINTLYLEADINRFDMKMMQPYMYYSGSTNLEEELGAEDWLLLQKTLPQLPVDALKKMRPWVVSQLILTKVLETMNQSADQHPSSKMTPYGIDGFLYQLAKKKKRKLAFFESAETQMRLLNEIQTAKDIAMMLHEKKTASEIEALVDLYRRQEIQEMYDSFIKEANEYDKGKEYVQRILLQRNKNWIPIIESCLNAEKKICLFAFGALHLPGREGVINLLKERGWQLKPYGKNDQQRHLKKRKMAVPEQMRAH